MERELRVVPFNTPLEGQGKVKRELTVGAKRSGEWGELCTGRVEDTRTLSWGVVVVTSKYRVDPLSGGIAYPTR